MQCSWYIHGAEKVTPIIQRQGRHQPDNLVDSKDPSNKSTTPAYKSYPGDHRDPEHPA